MFDFFSDMIWELRGFDSAQIRAAKNEKREARKKARYIFSKKAKIIVITVAAIYVAYAIFSIAAMWGHEGGSTQIIKNTLTAIIAVFVIVCLFLQKKVFELLALAGSLAFAVAFYLLIFI